MTQNSCSEYRKEIRRECLERVARLYTCDYQSVENPRNPSDLKAKTLRKVQEMDRIAWQEADSNENRYKINMLAQIEQFEQSIENQSLTPSSMAQTMIESLPALQNLASSDQNIPPEDANYLHQLIQFIQSIPINGTFQEEYQIDAIKIYYNRLFLPIQSRLQSTETPDQSFNGISASFIQKIENHIFSFCPNLPYSKILSIITEIVHIFKEQTQEA